MEGITKLIARALGLSLTILVYAMSDITSVFFYILSFVLIMNIAYDRVMRGSWSILLTVWGYVSFTIASYELTDMIETVYLSDTILDVIHVAVHIPIYYLTVVGFTLAIGAIIYGSLDEFSNILEKRKQEKISDPYGDKHAERILEDDYES